MKNKESKFGKFSNKFIIGAFSLAIIMIVISMIYNISTNNANANISEQVVTLVVTTLFLITYIVTRHIYEDNFSFIPDHYYYVAMIFAYFSTYLGSYLNFYEAFSWWDDVLHFSSGILIGLFAIIIVSYAIGNRFGKYKSKSDIVFLIVIGVLLSLSVAVFWEFYEFSYDYLLDGNMQRGTIVATNNIADADVLMRESGRIVGEDLMDTMNDMFLATSGAIIAGIYSFFHFSAIQLRINKDKKD